MSVDVGSSSTKSDPNVVPLCDILLVLLIIFMVITPAMQKGIDVKLPESGSDEPEGTTPNTAIVLTLEQDLSVLINTEKVDDLSLLENRLRDLFATRPNKTIFIRADESAPYQDVLRIIDIIKGAGIDVVGIIPQEYSTQK